MMRSNDSESRTILTYYLTRATGNPGFIWPVYLLYVLAHGVTYTQIGIIGTVQAIVVVGGEIPTGYVGDRIGRRNSLAVGSVLFTASAASYLIVETFLGFVLTFSLLSLGNAFISGSGDAWLYDTLKEQLDEGRFTHVRGRGGAIGNWSMTVTMIAGGLLYAVDPIYPFVAQTVMGGVNLLFTLVLPKNRQYTDEGEDTEQLTIIDALPVIRNQLSEPPLRSFIVYMSLFFGGLMVADAYVQPIAVSALETTFKGGIMGTELPESATLGFLYASFTVVSAIASDRAGDIEEALGVRRSVLFIPVVIAVFYVFPVIVPIMAFPMFFVMKGSRSVIGPIANHHVNRHVESVGRATVLSAVSMVYSLARIPFAVGSGVVADIATPRVSVAALGVAFLVGGGVAYLWEAPVRAENANVDASADASTE